MIQVLRVYFLSFGLLLLLSACTSTSSSIEHSVNTPTSDAVESNKDHVLATDISAALPAERLAMYISDYLEDNQAIRAKSAVYLYQKGYASTSNMKVQRDFFRTLGFPLRELRDAWPPAGDLLLNSTDEQITLQAIAQDLEQSLSRAVLVIAHYREYQTDETSSASETTIDKDIQLISKAINKVLADNLIVDSIRLAYRRQHVTDYSDSLNQLQMELDELVQQTKQLKNDIYAKTIPEADIALLKLNADLRSLRQFLQLEITARNGVLKRWKLAEKYLQQLPLTRPFQPACRLPKTATHQRVSHHQLSNTQLINRQTHWPLISRVDQLSMQLLKQPLRQSDEQISQLMQQVNTLMHRLSQLYEYAYQQQLNIVTSLESSTSNSRQVHRLSAGMDQLVNAINLQRHHMLLDFHHANWVSISIRQADWLQCPSQTTHLALKMDHMNEQDVFNFAQQFIASPN